MSSVKCVKTEGESNRISPLISIAHGNDNSLVGPSNSIDDETFDAVDSILPHKPHFTVMGRKTSLVSINPVSCDYTTEESDSRNQISGIESVDSLDEKFITKTTHLVTEFNSVGNKKSTEAVSDSVDFEQVESETDTDTEIGKNIPAVVTLERREVENSGFKPIQQNSFGQNGSIVDSGELEANPPMENILNGQESVNPPSSLSPHSNPAKDAAVPATLHSPAKSEAAQRELLLKLQYILLAAAALALVCILIYSIYYIILIRKIYAKDRVCE